MWAVRTTETKYVKNGNKTNIEYGKEQQQRHIQRERRNAEDNFYPDAS